MSGKLRTRLVVTGASGYIGGRLVSAALSNDRFDVRSIVRTDTPWLQGSVLEVGSLDQDASAAVDGADAVVHLAGANELVARSDPDEALASTVSASQAVAEACAVSGVKRLVYVSTVHVYGSALVPGALIEEDTVPAPLGTYATARLESERVITSSAGDTEVVILRLTNGVGPPIHPSVDRWSLVVNDLCRQAACGGPLRLLTDGQQWRDFVALEDVDQVLLAASDPEGMTPGTYNLASGHSTTIMEVAQLIARTGDLMGICPAHIEAPPAADDPPLPYRISVKRLAATGHQPRTPLAKAIADTLSFCWEFREQLCVDH